MTDNPATSDTQATWEYGVADKYKLGIGSLPLPASVSHGRLGCLISLQGGDAVYVHGCVL